jgi:hypothetical protein
MNERTANAIVSEMLEEVLGYLNDSQRKALLHDLIHEALLDQKGPAVEAIDRALSHQSDL